MINLNYFPKNARMALSISILLATISNILPRPNEDDLSVPVLRSLKSFVSDVPFIE